jgi:hypothetical protein
MNRLNALFLVALTACSGAANIASNSSTRLGTDSIMLRVTNTSDSPVRIGGYPSLTPPEPQPPGGILSLGVAPPGVSCLALPDSVVIHYNPATTNATTAVWRAMSDGISITGGGSSNEFVPGISRGWNITVPGDQTTPIAAAPCTR